MPAQPGDLLAWLSKRKQDAYTYAALLALMTPEALRVSGYRHGDPLRAAGESILKAHAEIEARIQAEERARS